ncbi:MAG TPA: PIG-L family deacetylase [Rhodanobacter sp.]|nr:PIG-L family deacetylase [Rhodanobacter sp.]
MDTPGQHDWPGVSSSTRLLVVAPHPDDETLATGLLIQQVRAAGGEVRIVLLTAGDNNPWPQRWLERRVLIGAADRRRWGQRRLLEMRQAMACLGVPQDALHTLDWPDLGVTGLLLASTNMAVAALAALIDGFTPTLIAFPSLADRHPDHGSAHVLVRLALTGLATAPALLTYLVHGDPGVHAGIELDGPPALVANKLAALEFHRSQMALSGTRMRRLAGRAERYAVELPATRLASTTTLPWQPPAWLRPCLRVSVVGPAGSSHWRWRDAPLRHDADGSFQFQGLPAPTGVPQFARVALTLPSPWIFDGWGWCWLGGSEQR